MLDRAEFERLIRPAGFYRVKADRLRGLVRFVEEELRGDLGEMRRIETQALREKLLCVKGVGPETADSILCYALGRPVVVADNYAKRVLSRHGRVSAGAGYDAVKQAMAEGLPVDAAIYNELHALMVKVGHTHCRRTPDCVGCPLEELLPPAGPVIG